LKVITPILLSLLLACSASNKVSKKVLKASYISIETSPCFGACPVYKLEIFSDGIIKLEGIKFVDIGTYTAQLTVGEHKSFVKPLHDLDWSQFKAVYRSGYSDLPSTLLRYSEVPGDTVQIDFELEAEALPQIFKKYALSIDSLRSSMDWYSLNES